MLRGINQRQFVSVRTLASRPNGYVADKGGERNLGSIAIQAP
jgi:hypothetical protein